MSVIVNRASHFGRLFAANLVTAFLPRTTWRRELKRNITYPSHEIFVREKYYQKLGEYPNLSNPLLFNEKINWLNIHDRRAILTIASDKYAVRDYVSRLGLGELLNELYGVYDTPDDIMLDSLPNKFVIKTNHANKTNIICTDKSEMNWNKSKQLINSWLATNHYHKKAEWAYRHIKPRIIIEKYLEGEPGVGLLDFKFYTFNGRVAYVHVDFDRGRSIFRAFYNRDWEKQPFTIGKPLSQKTVERPARLDDMIAIAEKIAAPFPFLRVDLYYFDNRIVFGEATVYPVAGFAKFKPDAYNRVFGDLIDLEQAKRLIAAGEPQLGLAASGEA
jgi:hypothetical protein